MLRNNTITTGVMIRAPAAMLEKKGIKIPCRNANLSSFPLAVAVSSLRL